MSSFRPDIEGLRAVAVILVIAAHVFGWPPGGFIGVDVFFVISGFLITGLLLRERNETGRIRLRTFYARRVRRLMPAGLLVLVVTVLAAKLVFIGERVHQTATDGVWAFAFLANVHFARIGTDYFEAERPVSPVQHYWSLSVEEQFYVLWPWLILLGGVVVLRGSSRGQLLSPMLWSVVGASMGWSLYVTANSPTQAYFSTPARAWELGIGALVAVHYPRLASLPAGLRRGAAWAGLGGVLAAALLITPTTPFPGIAAGMPVIATAALLAAGPLARSPGGTWVLSNAVSGYLGRISYSLYLWHFPVAVFAVALLGPRLSAANQLLVVAITVALSVGSFHLVERPVRDSSWLLPASDARRVWRERRAGRFRPGLVAPIALGAVVLLVVVVVLAAPHPYLDILAKRSPALSSASPAVPVTIDAAAAEQRLAELIRASVRAAKWGELNPSLSRLAQAGAPAWRLDRCNNIFPYNRQRCTYGPKDGTRDAVLLGDSTAISYMPTLRAALEPDGWRVHSLTLDQCPAVEVTTYRTRPGDPDVRCREHRRWTRDEIRALQPELVVMSSGFVAVSRQVDVSEDDPSRFARWEAGATRAIEQVAPYTDHIVVVGAPPYSGNLQSCVTRFSKPADCATRVSTDARLVGDAERRAAAGLATYVDPVPWLCAGPICPAVIGTTPVYWDGRHLTEAYATLIAPLFKARLPERASVPDPRRVT